MRITIHKKNFELTPALNIYIETKLLKPLRRLLVGADRSESVILDIELSRTTRHHRKGKVWGAGMIVTLPKEKEPLYAEVTDEDIHTAIDLLKEEIEQEIRKYKGRSVALTRRWARVAKKELRLDPAAQFRQKGSRQRDE